MAVVVRNITLIIFLTLLLIKGNAQSAINLHKKIAIPANTIQLDSLLHTITRQSGARFSINTSKIQASKLIAIKDHTPTIASILQVIKQSTGAYYGILGDHIILLDNPPRVNKKTTNTAQKQIVSSHKTASGKPAVTNQQPVQAKKVTVYTNPPAPSRSLTSMAIKIKQDIIAPKPKPEAIIKQPISTSQLSVPKQSVTANRQSTPVANSGTEAHPFFTDLFIKAGLSADDLFYCNPTIQIGKPYLYGIASYSTNFNISGFRYGAGGSVSLSDSWKLHLQLTTGNFSSKSDSMDLRWEFKTQLHRAGLIAETNLGNRFKLQFGPIFNLMKLTFYRNGKKSEPGLPASFIDQKFSLLKPVYTFNDTFSTNTAQSKKTWLGLQLSIFYNLNFFNPE